MPSLTRLTSQRMLDDTMTVLRTHIPLQAAGYRCQTDDLWRVLVAATARTRSIEAACASLVTAPHPGDPLGDYSRLSDPAVDARGLANA